MEQDARIQQFKQMTESDPENDLGHFSLGKAYFDAGQFEEAVGPLLRVIDLRPETSKAYQLAGDSLARTGQQEKAIEIVTRGVTVADKQGDHMPREAMIGMLMAWNAAVPELKAKSAPQAQAPLSPVSGDSGDACSRCGRPGSRLEKPPFKGDLGQAIFEKICTSCWQEWIPMGTKVINELGLSLSSQTGQDTYDQYMKEFLQLDQG